MTTLAHRQRVLSHLQKQEEERAKVTITDHYNVGRAWFLRNAYRMDEDDWDECLTDFCNRACPDSKSAMRLYRAVVCGLPPETGEMG